MQVIETTVFSFDELNDRAKEKARDWFKSTDFFYADYVIDDVKEVAAHLGIDIDRIFYSGFSSQGDGACFEGFYKYKSGWRNELKGYAPKDAELMRIGEALQKAQARHFYNLVASCKHRGHYYHSGCMDVGVEHSDDRCRDLQSIEDDVVQALRDFADWVYKMLMEAYDWTSADEQVDDSIEANGYTFTEDGKRFG
jgi:hypothetical protein